jgi:hypothetical protein
MDPELDEPAAPPVVGEITKIIANKLRVARLMQAPTTLGLGFI